MPNWYAVSSDLILAVLSVFGVVCNLFFKNCYSFYFIYFAYWKDTSCVYPFLSKKNKSCVYPLIPLFMCDYGFLPFLSSAIVSGWCFPVIDPFPSYIMAVALGSWYDNVSQPLLLTWILEAGFLALWIWLFTMWIWLFTMLIIWCVPRWMHSTLVYIL